MNAQLKESAAIRTALIWSLICAGVAGATFVLGNLFRHVVLIFLGKLGILIAIGVSLLLWGLSRLLGTARAKNVMQNLALLLASVMIAVLLGEVVVRIALKGITTTGDTSSYFARRWWAGHVHLNSSGFREREFESTKPRGSYRIAVIGDSYTF